MHFRSQHDRAHKTEEGNLCKKQYQKKMYVKIYKLNYIYTSCPVWTSKQPSVREGVPVCSRGSWK